MINWMLKRLYGVALYRETAQLQEGMRRAWDWYEELFKLYDAAMVTNDELEAANQVLRERIAELEQDLVAGMAENQALQARLDNCFVQYPIAIPYFDDPPNWTAEAPPISYGKPELP